MSRVELSAWIDEPPVVTVTQSPYYPVMISWGGILADGRTGSLSLSLAEARVLVDALTDIVSAAEKTDAEPAAVTADPAMTSPLVKEESS